MPTLRMGVIDVPYTAESYGKPRSAKAALGAAKRGKANAPMRLQGTSTTTGDVAEILEAKYHVMEKFFERHGQEIADAATESLKDFFEDQLAGSGRNYVSFVDAEQEIHTLFQQFIDAREVEGMGIPGVPTRAALRGVNHRMKDPYAKRGPRPSFRDTGLYEQSFIAKIEE